jgi:hypothetical protein
MTSPNPPRRAVWCSDGTRGALRALLLCVPCRSHRAAGDMLRTRRFGVAAVRSVGSCTFFNEEREEAPFREFMMVWCYMCTMCCRALPAAGWCMCSRTRAARTPWQRLVCMWCALSRLLSLDSQSVCPVGSADVAWLGAFSGGVGLISGFVEC